MSWRESVARRAGERAGISRRYVRLCRHRSIHRDPVGFDELIVLWLGLAFPEAGREIDEHHLVEEPRAHVKL